MSQSQQLKSDFVGTGTMKEFVSEVDLLLAALGNYKVIMPPYYIGAPVEMRLDKDSIILDFGDALVFSLNNIKWVFPGIAKIDSYTATVTGGKEVVTVTANPDLDNIVWNFTGTADITSYSATITAGALKINVKADIP